MRRAIEEDQLSAGQKDTERLKGFSILHFQCSTRSTNAQKHRSKGWGGRVFKVCKMHDVQATTRAMCNDFTPLSAHQRRRENAVTSLD